MSTFTKYPSSAKWIILALFLFNILCLAALWFGRPDGPHHRKHHQKLIHHIKKEISFDEQQLVTLDTLLIHQRLEQKKLHDAIKDLRIKMLDAVTKSDEKSLVSARTLADQIGNLTRQHELNSINHFEELKNLCNPEQRKVLIGIMLKATKKPPHKK